MKIVIPCYKCGYVEDHSSLCEYYTNLSEGVLENILKENYNACPDEQFHTKCPNGYVAWHEWAQEMSKTHKQIRCTTCGYFCIWIPK